MMPGASSAVTGDMLAALRENADHSPFLDPVVFRKAQAMLPAAERLDPGWLPRIIGRPVPSWTRLSPSDIDLAVKAADADTAYFAELASLAAAAACEAGTAADRAAAAARQAARGEWERCRALLPVPVTVCHNWTRRHLDGYEQGADHIVVLKSFTAGRLHRQERQCLCETPSRARQLRYVFTVRGDETRIPDCRACLRIAAAIAAAGEAR